MEVTLPFSAAPELPKLTRRGALHAVPRVLSVDVHLLNPRKVLVRVGYSLELEAFQPQNRTLAAGVADPEPWGICQKTGRLGTLQTAWVQEKAFTYQDTLTLPAGRPAAAELLSFRARCTCAEARVIGSKLVFKGEAVVHLLCRGGGRGGLCRGFPPALLSDHGRRGRQRGGPVPHEPGLHRGHLHPGGGGRADLPGDPGPAGPGGAPPGGWRQTCSPTCTAPPTPWRPRGPPARSAACWTRGRPRRTAG